MLHEFRSHVWQCNRCGKWNGVRNVYKDGEYYKKCKCGRIMVVTIKRVKKTRIVSEIVGLRDCYRRCNRGELKQWRKKD